MRRKCNLIGGTSNTQGLYDQMPGTEVFPRQDTFVLKPGMSWVSWLSSSRLRLTYNSDGSRHFTGNTACTKPGKDVTGLL